MTAAEPIEDPAFGIWRDREDMTDVEAYVRKIRAPRYGRDVGQSRCWSILLI